MQLTAVSKDNIKAYAAYRREIADEEGRRYFETIDLEKVILRENCDYFIKGDSDEILCAITIRRKELRNGSVLVMISVEDVAKKPETLASFLRLVLQEDIGKTAKTDIRYRAYDPPGSKFAPAAMAQMGFAEIPGTYRYLREPGPPREGEFPHADRAVAKGYRTLVLDDAYIASDPEIFEKLADIYNRAFSNRDSVTPTTAERIRKSYEAEANEIIIAKLGDEVTSSITLTNLGDSVFSPQYTCARRHWGTGSVDLMCRHLAELVAERWNVPIIGYAEATNAASWKALERFGLTRVEEYMVWERALSAGDTFTL